MNTLEKNKLPEVTLQDRTLQVKMLDGRVINVDLTNFAKLQDASKSQLKEYELSPFGIHWNMINEDLSFEGFFENADNNSRKVKN